MKKRGMVVFFLLCIVLIFSFISADYSFGEVTHSIDMKYGPEATLRGWINISLDEESSDSEFESSFENSEGDIISSTATLMTLIEGDADFDYDCDLLECAPNYVATEASTTKTITLGEGEDALIGFKIFGNAVSGFSIDIDSTAGVSDISQLSVDILNDEKNIWQFNVASGEFGDEKQGCYANGNTLANILSIKYCEKINLPASPNIEIGANLIGTTPTEFEMSIESLNEDEYGDCIISAPTESSCTPLDSENLDFIVKEQRDYFVCIKATGEANGYTINSETNEPCGFAGSFNGDYSWDFDIFAKSGGYGEVELSTLDDEEIIERIDEYLDSVYGGDCSNDCIIPIKIISNVEQVITVSSASLSYYDAGVGITTNDLYDLEKTPAKITADMQKLNIDAGEFSVPSDYGDNPISLSFNDEEIFEEEISIEKVPKIISLNILTTAVNYPTTFIVKVESEKNISSYEWDFGNEDTLTTTSNMTTYTYDAMETYNLKIKVIDEDGGMSSKTFSLTVGSAELITGTLLQEKKAGLANIKSQINDFSDFEVDIINQTLNIENIETKLNKAETDNAGATDEDDYQAVLQILQSIEVPQSIFPSSAVNSYLFYPQETKIKVNVLSDITGEEYDSSKEDKYIDSIRRWNVGNVDITVTYKEITSMFKDHNEPLVKFFEVDVTKKVGFEGDPYIILKDVSGLTFDGLSLTEKKSGYVYDQLIGESRKLIFATTENVNFIDLPLFVTPDISELSLVDFDWSPLEDSGKLKKWVLFVLIIILLIIIGAVFWIILQTWYRKKYENYLFKNKNNLYNLFNWIENAKKRGLTEKEAGSKLRKVGWTSEQVRYAMRKHAGKRTGMPGTPIKKIKELENKSVPQGRIPGNQPRKGSRQNF